MNHPVIRLWSRFLFLHQPEILRGEKDWIHAAAFFPRLNRLQPMSVMQTAQSTFSETYGTIIPFINANSSPTPYD